jgi:hypothetical protein
MNEVLTPGGAAVRMVAPPDMEAAKTAHASARVAVKEAERRFGIHKGAREALERLLSDARLNRAELLEETAEMEVQRACGESIKVHDIGSLTKRLADASMSVEVAGLALSLNDEMALAENIALLGAQADLKDCAASLIDAERYGRLETHQAAMDELAASEGEVELRSRRFEEEGRIADRYRADATALRENAAHMNTLYEALRSARGKVS